MHMCLVWLVEVNLYTYRTPEELFGVEAVRPSEQINILSLSD